MRGYIFPVLSVNCSFLPSNTHYYHTVSPKCQCVHLLFKNLWPVCSSWEHLGISQGYTLFPLLSSADNESQQWYKHIGSFAQNSLALAHIYLFQKNPPIQRAVLEWVCVSSLQRHCMVFSQDGGGESQGYDSQLTLGSVALGTLSSLRQSWYCPFLKHRPWKSWSQAQRTKEKEGSWESQEDITRKSLQWRWSSAPKDSAKASVASCWSGLSLESRDRDSGVPCREEHAPWASCSLTPHRKFRLLLLYRRFPEIWRLAIDEQTCDGYSDQDQGEDDHEADIGGVRKRRG